MISSVHRFDFVAATNETNNPPSPFLSFFFTDYQKIIHCKSYGKTNGKDIKRDLKKRLLLKKEVLKRGKLALFPKGSHQKIKNTMMLQLLQLQVKSLHHRNQRSQFGKLRTKWLKSFFVYKVPSIKQSYKQEIPI